MPDISQSKTDQTVPEKTPVWEDIAVIVSIVTLWPAVLRRETIISRIALAAALIVLLWILVRRIRRLNKTTRPPDKN